MTFTNEQLEKIINTKTPEELITLAKAEGIELSEENAAALFKNMNAMEAELSIEELDNVAGGYCWWIGDAPQNCTSCGSTNISLVTDYGGFSGGSDSYWVCNDCKTFLN